MEESHKTIGVLLAFNATFLTLIPKEERSLTPKYFHPIALYNVIFKIIKILANRLKPLLPFLISKEQTIYVEGWKIIGNIILTQEVIHSLKLNHSHGMIIKLDFSKAFDKINLQY